MSDLVSWLKKVPKFRSLDISSSSTFSRAHLCSTISRASHSLWDKQTGSMSHGDNPSTPLQKQLPLGFCLTLKALLGSGGIAMAAPVICSCMTRDWSAATRTRQINVLNRCECVCVRTVDVFTNSQTHHCPVPVWDCTCSSVQTHSGSTRTLNSPWYGRQ